MPKVAFPVELAGGVPVITPPEEIDITNAAGLQAALLEAAGRTNGHGTLVVDMSRTQFCDSSGVNALVRAHQRAQAEGGEVLLVVSAVVLRLLTRIGADRVIPHFATLDEALGRSPVTAAPVTASPAGALPVTALPAGAPPATAAPPPPST